MRYAVALASTLAFLTTAVAEELKTDDVEVIKEAPSSSIKKWQMNRFVPSNKPWRVASFNHYVELDCSAADQVVVRVTKSPEHGTIDLVPGKYFPNFKKDGPLVKCNDSKVEGIAVVYRSERDYKGPDKAGIQVFFPGGSIWDLDYTLVVK